MYKIPPGVSWNYKNANTNVWLGTYEELAFTTERTNSTEAGVYLVVGNAVKYGNNTNSIFVTSLTNNA